jgi:acetoin utilization deacetylase AcuC-like enzyme
VLDPIFAAHDTGPGHPESPERIRSVVRRLTDSGIAARCVPVEPEEIDGASIALVHDPAYDRRVRERCERGPGFLDTEDTYAGPDSPRVARVAAGSLVALADRVARGELARGFAVVRPPGHHAERGYAMGFCLYNNVAIAARCLQRDHGIERVMVVDWDVHHGNGTQHLFDDDPSVLYASVHQSPLYPGTGAETERGIGPGVGYTRNLPLPPGAGDDRFLGALSGPVVEDAERFRPGFVLVSAGFDAHVSDPLAGLTVSTGAFAEATRILRGIADRHAGGRLVSVLEGGYDLEALADSVAAHVEALLEP